MISKIFENKDLKTLIRENWKAGLAVALVNIPLSISLAIAAGATPLMGIITAIWAGLFAAILGGSDFNIVGPTGALSGLLATYALTNGVGSIPTLAIMSGFIVLLVYIFKWERYITFIPGSAIHGFTLGVAFIIGLNQLNFATGLSGLKIHETFLENILESLANISKADPITFIIFLASLVFLFIWTKKIPSIPGAIVLAPVGIIFGFLMSKGFFPFELQTIFTKFGEIKTAIIDIPTFSTDFLNRNLIVASLSVALVAIIETLLSAKIAADMTGVKYDRKKEVFGLSVANIASGFFGGIPATAALARTALNVKSKANNRMSSVINVFFVILISLILLPVFKFLPLSIIAAILVHVAVRMVDKSHFERFWEDDKTSFGLSMAVAIITVVEDPIIGILVGAVLSLLIFINKLSEGQSEIAFYDQEGKFVKRVLNQNFLENKETPKVIVYRFSGALTYINSGSHLEIIEKIKDAQTVIFSMRNLFFIDLDGLDALEEMIKTLTAKKIKVCISSVSDTIEKALENRGFYKEKCQENLVFRRSAEALEKIKSI